MLAKYEFDCLQWLQYFKRTKPMKSLLRVVCTLALLLCVLFISWGLFAPAVHADGGAPQLAYVAGAAQGVGVIDIAQRHSTSTFALAGQPRMVLLSTDGSVLYVTQPGLGRVAALATKTGKILCTADLPDQPSLLAVSIDATVLYVAGQGGSSVYALNPTTCARERSFETHEPVYGLAVAASAAANATPSTPNQIWATGNTGLTIFDTTGRLLGTAPIAGGPQYISIPAGFTAYVTTRQGSVLAVDLNTRRVIRVLLSGGDYGPMDYDATTGEVYVPDLQHTMLDVLTPIAASTAVMPREPARHFALSSTPQSIAITNDGQLGFVALANGQVLMLDIPGRSIVASIAVGGTPRFIITGLYPPARAASLPAQSSVSSPSPALSGGLLALFVLLVLVCAGVLGSFWFFWRRARKAQ
jgi:DNA-binding beta-propeller fold protein YncE